MPRTDLYLPGQIRGCFVFLEWLEGQQARIQRRCCGAEEVISRGSLYQLASRPADTPCLACYRLPFEQARAAQARMEEQATRQAAWLLSGQKLASRKGPYPVGAQIGPYTVLAILPGMTHQLRHTRYRVRLACCGARKAISDNMLLQIHRGKEVSGLCRECLDVLRKQGDPTRKFVIPLTHGPVMASWSSVLAMPIPTGLSRDPWGRPCLTN